MAKRDNTKQNEAQLLREAEELYQKLFQILPTKVTCKPVSAPTKERIPFKAHMAKAGLIYRAVDITGATLDLLKQKRPTVGFILVRCVFETTAALFLLYERLQKVVESGKLVDIDGFLNKLVLGGRSESTPKAPDGSTVKSVHISKAIKGLSKEFKSSFAREYGFICEFVHPNFLGTVGSYGELDKEHDLYFFSLDASYKSIPEPSAYGLHMLLLSLAIFSHYYEKITDILPKFTKICEAVNNDISKSTGDC